MPSRRTLLGLVALAALVGGAHWALWASPRMPDEVKWRLTLLNALGWAVVLLPAAGVSLWLRAQRRRPPARKGPR
jgi:hypothetical protein